MSRLQLIIIAITIGLNGLDGYDILAISFASPGISRDWGINRAALGVLLSMELVGMALGSIALGRLADRSGRRPTLLMCLSIMAVGMIMASRAHGIFELSAWRIGTGVGIGGMLATVSAVVAEFSNTRRRNLNIALMALGYPTGAIVGGSIAAWLLTWGDWRLVFGFGAALTAIFLPIVAYFVPESVSWLCERCPPHALARLNRTLVRMERPMIDVLPAVEEVAPGRGNDGIFTPERIRLTLLVSAAYLFHIATFYFVLKWAPKIVTDLGFTPASAATVLVWANVGGATGGAIFGLLSLRINLKSLTIVTSCMSSLMVIILGEQHADFIRLCLACAAVGFFANAAIVGFYAIFVQVFAPNVRGTGTGFAIGAGRFGAVLSPITAGLLFNAGHSVHLVALVMSAGSIVAASFLLISDISAPQT